MSDSTNPYSVAFHPIPKGKVGYHKNHRIFYFHPKLTKMAAVFLQDVVDIAVAKDDHEVIDGWFRCSTDYLTNKSKWSRTTQWRMFGLLEELGVVDTVNQGIPPVRWVRVNLEVLIGMAREADHLRNGCTDDDPMFQVETDVCFNLKHLYREEHLPKNTSAPGRADQPGGMEVLFDPEQGRTKASPITEFDLSMAKLIKEGITKRYGMAFPYRQDGWADHVRKLRKDLTTDPKLGDPMSRIARVARWWSSGTERIKLPIRSAEKFRQWFITLEDMATKATKQGAQVEVSPKAQEIADRLTKHNHWPKGSAGQVPQVVEQSIRNIRSVVKRCRTLVDSGRPIDRYDLVGMAKLVLDWIKVTSPENRVEIHLERVSDQVARWDGWSGNLCQYVWRLDQKMVRQQVMEHGAEYCGSVRFAKWWDKVKDELLEGL